MNTWGHIANLLGKDKGAKWSEVPTNLTFWPSTLSCAGIYVFVSSEATEKTMEAANALGKGLAKTLPPSPDKMPSVVNAQSSRLATDSGWESKDAPWRLVAYHPDVITVMIGVHP